VTDRTREANVELIRDPRRPCSFVELSFEAMLQASTTKQAALRVLDCSARDPVEPEPVLRCFGHPCSALPSGGEDVLDHITYLDGADASQNVRVDVGEVLLVE
jgi:hypothetical protein